MARASATRAPKRAAGAKDLPSAALSREQILDLYYWMRLTRTLEERLVALYRQTKVVGGLFRSLGQEADAVGSAYALPTASASWPSDRKSPPTTLVCR